MSTIEIRPFVIASACTCSLFPAAILLGTDGGGREGGREGKKEGGKAVSGLSDRRERRERERKGRGEKGRDGRT